MDWLNKHNYERENYFPVRNPIRIGIDSDGMSIKKEFDEKNKLNCLTFFVAVCYN